MVTSQKLSWSGIIGAMAYKKHKKPTPKQAKFLAILEANPSMTPTEAGRQAGYSESTVNTIGKAVLNKPIVKTILDNYKYQLEQHDINPKRLASKLDKLLDAKDIIVDRNGIVVDTNGEPMYKEDRKAQVDAIKLLHEIYGVGKEVNKDNQPKRRITLEEFEEKELT